MAAGVVVAGVRDSAGEVDSQDFVVVADVSVVVVVSLGVVVVVAVDVVVAAVGIAVAVDVVEVNEKVDDEAVADVVVAVAGEFVVLLEDGTLRLPLAKWFHVPQERLRHSLLPVHRLFHAFETSPIPSVECAFHTSPAMVYQSQSPLEAPPISSHHQLVVPVAVTANPSHHTCSSPHH